MEIDLELDDRAFERYRLDMEAMNRYRMSEEENIHDEHPEGKNSPREPEGKKVDAPAKKRHMEGRTTMCLSLPSELHAKAKMVCTAKGVSMSSVLGDLLKDYVNRELRKDPKLREFLGD